MMDIGVAKPRAQGQAMIRTATALARARAAACTGAAAKLGSVPNHNQSAQRERGRAHHRRREPARHRIGQLLHRRAASLCGGTISMICASKVSLPTRSARIRNAPVLIERGARYPIAGGLGDRHGFAGDHRLVHAARAFQHNAIHRNLFAGPAPAACLRCARG